MLTYLDFLNTDLLSVLSASTQERMVVLIFLQAVMFFWWMYLQFWQYNRVLIYVFMFWEGNYILKTHLLFCTRPQSSVSCELCFENWQLFQKNACKQLRKTVINIRRLLPAMWLPRPRKISPQLENHTLRPTPQCVPAWPSPLYVSPLFLRHPENM